MASITIDTIDIRISVRDKATPKINAVKARIDALTNKFPKLKSAITKYHERMAKFSAAMPRTSKLLKGLRNTILEITFAPFYLMGKGIQKMWQAAKKFQQLAVRMAMRKIFTSFIEGFNEGVQSAYLFSETTDKVFSNNMDNLYSSLKFLQLSLVSMFLPLINAVSSFAENLMGGLSNTFSTIAEYIAALTGQSTFMKAKENAMSFSDTIQDATNSAEELKRTIMGFDDMNVLNDNNTSSSDKTSKVISDFANMWEMSNVSAEVMNNCEKWREKLKKIKESLEDLWETIRDEAFPRISEFVDNVSNLMLQIPWDKMISAASTIVFWISKLNDAMLLDDVALLVLGMYASIGTGSWVPLAAAFAINLGVDIYQAIKKFGSVTDEEPLSNAERKELGIPSKEEAESNYNLYNIDGRGKDFDTWFTMKYGVTPRKAYGYATGGFVGEVPFFMNRSEMIGKFSGNRTVVANNQQITDGIASAVYNAIVSAGGFTDDVNVNLDGDALFDIVVNKNNFEVMTTGESPMLV